MIIIKSNFPQKAKTKIEKKIDAKKDQILKASWKAIILENLRFWKPTWRQVGAKIEAEIDVIFERRFFEKTVFSPGKKPTFLRSSGLKLGPKIDVKNDAETERLENSILIDF